MAQKRIRNYKNPLTSFEHNIKNFGLHAPGRYCGFDTLVRLTALTFNINHAGTGITYRDQINTLKGPMGYLISQQGVIISEDAPIGALAIDTNAGNASIRYDLFICTHTFINVTGGAAAVYSIIKGPLANPIYPILDDPGHQIALGVIKIPPGSVDVVNCTYKKMKCPDSGDGEDARLTEPNIFRSFQGDNASAGIWTVFQEQATYSGNDVFFWEFWNDGNVFKIEPATAFVTYVDGIRIMDIPPQEGMRIRIIAGSKVVFRENRQFESGAQYAAGYRALAINPGIANVNVGPAGGGSQWGVEPAAGEKWEMEFVFIYNRWFLTKIGGAGTATAFRRGMTIGFYGDVASNFDAQGLGINLMSGFAILNGNNSTPDARGKNIGVMGTDVPAAGRPVLTQAQVILDGGDPEDYVFGPHYTSIGKTGFLIDQAHLPDYMLEVDDPGHYHTAQNSNDQLLAGKFTTGGSAPEGGLLQTETAVTGISVDLNGGGQRLFHVTPHYMFVWVMKT